MISYKILQNAWNKIKVDKLQVFKKQIPSISDTSQILIKRVNEDVSSITISFSNIDSATANQKDIPLIKKMIITWLRKISTNVTIVRGNNLELIIKIDKDLKTDNNSLIKLPKEVQQPSKSPLEKINKTDKIAKKLTNIVSER